MIKKLYFFAVFLVLGFVFGVGFAVGLEPLVLYREEYSPGENIQAEVETDSPVVSSFIPKIYLGEERIPISYSIYEKNDKKFYISILLPTTISSGDYKLKISNLIVNDKGLYRSLSLERNFKIVSFNKGFIWLNKQDTNDITDLALSILALSNKFDVSARVAKLKGFMDSKGCFPVGNCNVRDTSFAYIALKNSGEDVFRVKNWLESSANSFLPGNWFFDIKSDQSGECYVNNLRAEVITGKNIFQLIPVKEVNISCSSVVSEIILRHEYLGNNYEIKKISGNKAIMQLSDEGCYGNGYKTVCDFESTAYAYWVFGKQANQWMTDNYDNTKTLHHALMLLAGESGYHKDWLKNNFNGYWASCALSECSQADAYITAFAYLALNEQAYFRNVDAWVRGVQESNGFIRDFKSTASILYSVYNSERIIPSVAVSPSIIQAGSGKEEYLVYVYNRLGIKTDIKLETGNARISFDKNKFSVINKNSFYVTVDNMGQDDFFEMVYEDKKYKIPVWVSAQAKSGGSAGGGKQEEEVIAKENLSFVENGVVLGSLLLKDKFEHNKYLVLRNFGGDVSNLTINVTSNLIRNIEFLPFFVKLFEEGEEMTITMHVIPPENDTEGGVILSTSSGVNVIPLAFSFKEEIIKEIDDEYDKKTEVGDIAGEFYDENLTETVVLEKREEENLTEKPESEKKGSGAMPAIILFVAVLLFLVIVGAILYLKSKKKGEDRSIGNFGFGKGFGKS